MLKNQDLWEKAVSKIEKLYWQKKIGVSHIKTMALKSWLLQEVSDSNYVARFKDPIGSKKATKSDMVNSINNVMPYFNGEDLSHSGGVTKGVLWDFEVFGVISADNKLCLSLYFVHEFPLTDNQKSGVQSNLELKLIEIDKNICELI
jgi:hypothetical protein